MKTCSKCKETKALSEFHFSKRSSDSRQHRCKSCAKAFTQPATKQWRKNSPEGYTESTKRTKVKLKYGISVEDIENLMIQQNSLCALCKNPISFNSEEKKDKPHIDHDHESGIVRGLLCLTCNTGLGMFKDSFDLLEQAKQYLQRSIKQRERLNELTREGCDSPTLRELEP